MKTFRLLISAAALAASATFAQADGRAFFAYLYGGNERPVLGDLDSFGIATVTINSATSICYSILLHNTTPNTAAHIHSGPPHIAGPVALALPINPNVPLRIGNCVPAPAAFVAALRANPQNFYVNVHNPARPAGAARGQLQ